MRILLPKVSPNLLCDPVPLPLFFLAGPVRGGGDWQADMCELLAKLYSADFYAAVPCRWQPGHRTEKYWCEGVVSFKRQLDWERQYLQIAATQRPGCIIFWLPCESKSDPHPGPEPYAMDTRGELGEWRGRMAQRDIIKHPYPHIVIGAEREFHGLSQIERNFKRAVGAEFPIYETMEETARAAIRMSARL